MSKTLTKVMAILIIAMMSLVLTATPVFADDPTPTPTAASDPLNWDGVSVTPQETAAATSVGNIAGAILSVVQVVGVAVAIIMLIVLAIKYISAAPNDKAEIKKHAVVYVVGALVLFGASGIIEVIKQLAAKF